MAEIEYTVRVARPRMDVFRYVGDLQNSGAWQPSVQQVSLIEGTPVRAGTMMSQTRKFLGRTAFLNVDVVDYQLNKVIELKGIYMGFPYRRIMEFDSNGRETVIRDTITMRTGCFYFWYAPILTNRVKAQTIEEWNTLKRNLE